MTITSFMSLARQGGKSRAMTVEEKAPDFPVVIGGHDPPIPLRNGRHANTAMRTWLSISCRAGAQAQAPLKGILIRFWHAYCCDGPQGSFLDR
jgi:hypothetical protein